MIIDETYTIIKEKYDKRFNEVTLEQVVIGIYFTAVKLSSGYSGLAYTNLDSVDCCSHNRQKGFGDFTPGNFKGRRVVDLFSHYDQTCLMKTIQLAVMNAISAELMAESSYKIIENQDPIGLVDLQGKKRVCVVGAFLSYIKKIAETDCILQIVELDETVVPEEYKQYLLPSHLSEKAISNSDIVIITGATLVNNTLDKLLELISIKTQVILVGPTSSLIPDVLFARGVNILGATQISDSDKMLEMVAEGASGFQLFKTCATKICIVNES
ncbi:MAG: DUF364 domain-containing protein [Bacteroidota bacterium]